MVRRLILKGHFYSSPSKNTRAMSLVGKRITQSTFDEVVRENINDLELEPDEAIADAIEQFKAQVCCMGFNDCCTH